MRPATDQYHAELNAICYQLSELANTTIPQAGDSAAGSDPDSMGRWISALGAAVSRVRSIAESPYPYDNSH
jgi:hypothetical protein